MIESRPAALLTLLLVIAAMVLGRLIGPLAGFVGLVVGAQFVRSFWYERKDRQLLAGQGGPTDVLGGEQFRYPRLIKTVGRVRFWFDWVATLIVLVAAGVLDVSTTWRVALLIGGVIGCWRVWLSARMLHVLETVVEVYPEFITEIQPNGSRISIPFESVSLLRDENGNVLAAYSTALGFGIDLNPKRDGASRMYGLIAQQLSNDPETSDGNKVIRGPHAAS